MLWRRTHSDCSVYRPQQVSGNQGVEGGEWKAGSPVKVFQMRIFVPCKKSVIGIDCKFSAFVRFCLGSDYDVLFLVDAKC